MGKAKRAHHVYLSNAFPSVFSLLFKPLFQLRQLFFYDFRSQRHEPVFHHDLLTLFGKDKFQEFFGYRRQRLIGLLGDIDEQAPGQRVFSGQDVFIGGLGGGLTLFGAQGNRLDAGGLVPIPEYPMAERSSVTPITTEAEPGCSFTVSL